MVQSERCSPESSLISARELDALSDQTNVKIIDVRGTWQTPARSLREDYLAQHIPGAVFLDWTREFIAQNVPLALASVSNLEGAAKSFANLGIHGNDRVVVYDDYHHMFAGRIWWAMRYWGFENVRILNGGLRHWISQDLPVSSQIPVITRGSFQPSRRSNLRLSLDEFLVQRNQARVLDGGSEIWYAGEPDNPRTGHIPGATSVSWRSLLDETTGLFLDKTKLEALFDRKVPDWRQSPIISSCGSGYSGTVPIVALYELGVQASLFDGSFAVWKQDPTREVEQS